MRPTDLPTHHKRLAADLMALLCRGGGHSLPYMCRNLIGARPGGGFLAPDGCLVSNDNRLVLNRGEIRLSKADNSGHDLVRHPEVQQDHVILGIMDHGVESRAINSACCMGVSRHWKTESWSHPP